MKCQFIRDDIEVSPPIPVGHEGQIETREVFRNHEMLPVTFWKKGAILETPDAWLLVQMGVALPADEDCRARAKMSPEKLAVAKHAYERLNAGIHPDDFQLFDTGIITGYNPDGSYKPGPNFAQLAKAEEKEEDDE